MYIGISHTRATVNMTISGLEINPIGPSETTSNDITLQSGKDEFSFTELVLLYECPSLTIIGKDK